MVFLRLVPNGIGLKCRFNALLARVSTSVFSVDY
jgi:hypothetical protein